MQSYRNSTATWLGSPNFSPGRNGHDMTQPSWVVLHTMVGTEAAADARFQQASEQASATYGVRLDGSVVQWVDEADGAWANGATGRGGKGDNLDSISIEHEDNGDYNGPRTPQLYAASVALVRDICQRYGIPIDRDHIIGHRECDFSSTACPDALDVDRIVREAAVPAQEADMTPDESKQLGQVASQVDGLWRGWYAHDALIKSILANLGVEKSEVDKILADIKAPAPVDVTALATALEPLLAAHLAPGLDPVVVAKAVAQELGKALDAAP